MTYGRVHCPADEWDRDGAAVSHLAELVRGELSPLLVADPRTREVYLGG
jgi:hypothetical protein